MVDITTSETVETSTASSPVSDMDPTVCSTSLVSERLCCGKIPNNSRADLFLPLRCVLLGGAICSVLTLWLSITNANH